MDTERPIEEPAPGRLEAPEPRNHARPRRPLRTGPSGLPLSRRLPPSAPPRPITSPQSFADDDKPVRPPLITPQPRDPHTSFTDGLAATIDWYRANEDWWRGMKAATEATYAKAGQ
ncbi:MAG TPA: hypothetical protein DEG88_02030 [Propionibacteriaceae bacterium]|nr:hypothetical protein [Propionibacteriaceae bacterium]HBY22107.1 hypothetical protein [Propionibacteriaceae bacterium]